MTFDPCAPLPLVTAGFPGIGGRIKVHPEDFEVEELPAYEPCGEGPFLYLWVEKRDMGAEYFARQVARRLDLRPGDVGTAGLKDRRAVTRQWVSVPAAAEERIGALEGDGIRLLKTGRHGNKLKPGHLHGNHFRVLIRDPDPDRLAGLPGLLDRLAYEGVPNFYGPQRFGRDGETWTLGMAMLRGQAGRNAARSPFLRKLALSAAQSGLFNRYLERRLADGLLRRVLPGDVMAKWPAGGMFVAQDLAAEQRRFEARETVPAGPIFGRKTFAAAGEAADREAAVLEEAGLGREAFAAFGKLVQGTRRHNLIYLEGLRAETEPGGLRLQFTLPAGSYATVVLGEVMKAPAGDAVEEA